MKVEFHRHLEGALPLALQATLLANMGEPVAGGGAGLRGRTCVVRPMRSLNEVLACFDLFGRMLATLEDRK